MNFCSKELQNQAIFRFHELFNKKNSNFMPYFTFAGKSKILCLQSIHKSIISGNIEDLSNLSIKYGDNYITFYGFELSRTRNSFLNKSNYIKQKIRF